MTEQQSPKPPSPASPPQGDAPSPAASADSNFHPLPGQGGALALPTQPGKPLSRLQDNPQLPAQPPSPEYLKHLQGLPVPVDSDGYEQGMRVLSPEEATALGEKHGLKPSGQ